jgi:hypothetical protein
MVDWTLGIDESGDFEESSERAVIGGVLVPEHPNQLRKPWRDRFDAWCSDHACSYPPHASKLDPMWRESLRATVADMLVHQRGLFVFVDATGMVGGEHHVGYLRHWSGLIDLCCRIVSAKGGGKLHLRPASRTLEIDQHEVSRMKLLGLPVSTHEGQKPRVSPLLEAEARQTVNALRREDVGAGTPWPDVDWEVNTATWAGVHPAVAVADVGCNGIRRALLSPDAVSLSLEKISEAAFGDPPPEVLLVHAKALPALRKIDREMRASVPGLVSASSMLQEVLSDAENAQLRTRDRIASRQGAVVAAQLMWQAGVRALAASGAWSNADRSETFALTLAAQCEATLAQKGGAFAATARALDVGWTGNGALAEIVRKEVEDSGQVVAARLWRLAAECANHLGDIPEAARARQRFNMLFDRGPSVALLAERIEVENLYSVTLQNDYLVDPSKGEDHAKVTDDLARATVDLEKIAEEAGATVGMWVGSSAPVPATSLDEIGLWKGAGMDLPTPTSPDIPRGKCYGTIARTHAFMGKTTDAVKMQFRARRFFFGSPRDLAFNATGLVRMASEHARCGGTTYRELARRALDMIGPPAPSDAARRVLARSSARFAIDAVLRVALWSPASLTPETVSAWARVLVADKRGSLLEALSSGLMASSHPTELLARHAGELCRSRGDSNAADRWFRLALEACSAAPEGSLIRKLARLTEAIRTNPTFISTDPPGTVLNPTFEYR